jgi:hypothetical protein
MEGVFSAPAKRIAVAGAMESASEEIEPELVAEAVRSTETLEGKKNAAAQAVRSIPELNERANIFSALQTCRSNLLNPRMDALAYAGTT